MTKDAQIAIGACRKALACLTKANEKVEYEGIQEILCELTEQVEAAMSELREDED